VACSRANNCGEDYMYIVNGVKDAL
jgi:hypothetical protein